MKNTSMKVVNAKGRKLTRKEKGAIMIMLNFFQNTGYVKGKPGMKEVYWIPLEEVTVIPEPTSTFGLPGDTSTATGAWTVTNGFIKLMNDLFKGSQLKYMSEGDLTSPTEKSEVSGTVLGFNAEQVERFNTMLGVPGVLVIKDNTCPTDTYWVVGCKCDPCYLKIEFDSDLVGGSKGKAWSFTFSSFCRPYLWTQGINTLPLSTVVDLT